MVILMALCMTEEPIWLLFSWPTNQKSCWAFNGSGKEWVAVSETERDMEGPLQRIRYIWRPSSQLDETVNIDNAPWDEKSLFFFFFFRYICWISYSECIEGLSSFFSIPVFWILSSLLFLIRSEICREWSVRWSRPPLECTIFFRWFKKKRPRSTNEQMQRGAV